MCEVWTAIGYSWLPTLEDYDSSDSSDSSESSESSESSDSSESSGIDGKYMFSRTMKENSKYRDSESTLCGNVPDSCVVDLEWAVTKGTKTHPLRYPLFEEVTGVS